MHLKEAEHEPTFGGKAVSLGAAIRAGLPVPHGIAVPAALVDLIASGDLDAVAAVRDHPHFPEGRVAVRSSAVGEDSATASFAGQHATLLNVARSLLREAVHAVWESGRSEAALAYRSRRGITAAPSVAVVVQTLVEAVAAGVLFTRNPVTGADEILIEAAWGLGEAVVSGRVVPDTYRLDSRGSVLECTAGDKDVRIWYDDESGTAGGTIELPVSDDLRGALCLDREQLQQLHALAARCRAVWQTDLDLEWALAPDGTIHLLQSRPITT